MNEEILSLVVLIPVAYLLGSIPTGIVIARILGGEDPRKVGSRNIGATNVSRSAGKTAGILTLAADALKGAVPTLVAVYTDPASVKLISLVGLSAFVGHLFPVFLAFRGGKGVATALGVMVVVSPVATVFSAFIFFVVVMIKRFVSLGSIIAASLLPVFLSILPQSRAYMPMGIAVAVLIIIKHKENIKRLVAGTENRI